MSAPFMRARTVPEILDASFQLLRQHYLPIVTATGIILLPSLLLAALLPPAWAPLADLTQNVFINFAAAATVLVVADVALGREPDMHGALRVVRRKAWMILAAAVVQGFLVLLGFLLLIIPGIIAMALFFAVPIVVVVEGKVNVSDVLGRSAQLAKGSMLRVLGSSVLALIIVMVAGMGMGLVIGLSVGDSRISDLLIQTFSIFLYPFPAVVSTLLYFDLRIRKEGFGLDDLSGLGAAEAPRYHPAGY